jgi:hypothetical protein
VHFGAFSAPEKEQLQMHFHELWIRFNKKWQVNVGYCTEMRLVHSSIYIINVKLSLK